MKTPKSNLDLCQFPFADGRYCRMPRSRDHEHLCLFHADRERRLFDRQALDSGDISDLFGPSGELRTNTDVNAYLTRLVKHAVSGRISPAILSSLVYAGALLLQSTSSVRAEHCSARGLDSWIAELRRIYAARSAQQKPSPPAMPPSSNSN